MANQEALKSSGTPFTKQRQQKEPSRVRTGQPTKGISPSQGIRPSQTPAHKENRNAKRARWAKKSKPVVKPVAPRKGPEKEYISACCSVPARKPRAGQKESSKDPESGKLKTIPKGLGHWRCGGCGKATKVTPRKPQGTEVVTVLAPPAVMGVTVVA